MTSIYWIEGAALDRYKMALWQTSMLVTKIRPSLSAILCRVQPRDGVEREDIDNGSLKWTRVENKARHRGLIMMQEHKCRAQT